MTGTLISVTLNEEEREILQEVLEEQHRTLLLEIGNTDHQHFRSVLKKKAAVLEGVLNRMMMPA